MSETEADKLTERVELRARPFELETWKRAAELEGDTLAAWLRKRANKGSMVPGAACACEQSKLELERGNEPRARLDAVRAIFAVLEPFSEEARERIVSSYAQLRQQSDDSDDETYTLMDDDP